MENTLILIKPDGVQRGLVGPIIGRFEQRGLKLRGLKFMQMSSELAAEHYAIHRERPFYQDLISYITSGPIVAMVWEGKDAVTAARATIGATNPVTAAPGSIRGDFGMEIGRNLVHGSDGPENASKEVALFFEETELVDWIGTADRWIRE